MLVMTPEAKRLLRKERNRERDALRGHVGEARSQGLAHHLASVIRLAVETGKIASVFGLEGPLRAGLRAALCRQGWRWAPADLAARELLGEIFTRMGAKRPDWNEGQPEWAIEAGTLIERTRCANCHGPLPQDRRKFCSDLCAGVQHSRIARLKQADEDTVVKMVTGWT